MIGAGRAPPFGRGRAQLLPDGDPVPLRRPRQRSGAEGDSGSLPAPLRRPGQRPGGDGADTAGLRPAEPANSAVNGQDVSVWANITVPGSATPPPISGSRVSAPPVPSLPAGPMLGGAALPVVPGTSSRPVRSALNPLSAEFVPAAARAASAALAANTSDTAALPAGEHNTSFSSTVSSLSSDSQSTVSSLNSFTVDTGATVNYVLLQDIPDPEDDYQEMIYSNLRESLWNMSSLPASFDKIAVSLVDNLNGWLPSSDIQLSTVLNWMLNQVACFPSFRYNCSKLCQLMTTRCKVTQDGKNFRTLLLARCQQLYQCADAVLAEDLRCFSELLLLFCELYLHLRLAGSGARIQVLGTAILGLLQKLAAEVSVQRVPTICQAVKLTGAVLDQEAVSGLDPLMNQLRAAALDERLPPECRNALLELTTLRASRWGGHTEVDGEPAGAAAAASAPRNDPHQQYGAGGGQQLTEEEELFLEQYLASLNQEDVPDDYEEEVDDAYEEFLHDLASQETS